jgi:hypothetical protein
MARTSALTGALAGKTRSRFLTAEPAELACQQIDSGRKFREHLDAYVADLDFEAVEMAARRQALRLAGRALEQRLNADLAPKTFESVLGPLLSKWAYYHSAQCQSG